MNIGGACIMCIDIVILNILFNNTRDQMFNNNIIFLNINVTCVWGDECIVINIFNNIIFVFGNIFLMESLHVGIAEDVSTRFEFLFEECLEIYIDISFHINNTEI